MADTLNADDADQLTDLAGRCKRAAQTARRIMAANRDDPVALLRLQEVAERADGLASSATALAEWIESALALEAGDG